MQRQHSPDSQPHRPRLVGPLKGCALPRLALLALAVTMAAPASPAQAPQFPGGFGRPGRGEARDPAETAAYSAAVSETDPGARASALQQFLSDYPNSPLRQMALAQIMMAKRQGSPVATPPAMTSRPAPAPAVVAPVEPAQIGAPARDSLLLHAPNHAQVTVAANTLTIKADNSTLSQILHDVSGSTGMKIEGLSKDERVYGNYGPGDARDVLLALLEGSGYNVVMVGDTAGGAPRELSLTQRSAASATAASPVASASADADDDAEPEAPPVQPEPAVNTPPPGPPPVNDGSPSRTPQEVLQQLQQLRQQQQQSQPQ